MKIYSSKKIGTKTFSFKIFFQPPGVIPDLIAGNNHIESLFTLHECTGSYKICMNLVLNLTYKGM